MEIRKQVVEEIRPMVKEHLTPSKKYHTESTSYGLKHFIEWMTKDKYITEDEFIEAMRLEGFEIKTS